MIPWWKYVYTFALGSAVGSFLNVVIYRLPRGGSLLTPPSHCPFCCEPIAWYDNIPIFSYLLLFGRCRRCKVRISPQYAFVEALTGALFCWILYRLSRDSAAFSYARLFAFVMLAAALVASTLIDLKRQIIPDEITIPGIFVGPLVALSFPSAMDCSHLLTLAQRIYPGLGQTSSCLGDRPMALLTSVLGVIAGGGTIYAAGVIGKTLFRKEAMGEGDVKFMAMVGGIIGPISVMLSFVVACLLGSIIGTIILIRWRRTRIPFAPYLSLGSLAVMLYQAEILGILSTYSQWFSELVRVR